MQRTHNCWAPPYKIQLPGRQICVPLHPTPPLHMLYLGPLDSKNEGTEIPLNIRNCLPIGTSPYSSRLLCMCLYVIKFFLLTFSVFLFDLSSACLILCRSCCNAFYLVVLSLPLYCHSIAAQAFT